MCSQCFKSPSLKEVHFFFCLMQSVNKFTCTLLYMALSVSVCSLFVESALVMNSCTVTAG